MGYLQKLATLLFAFISAIIPPGLVVYIAISHNSQNEYVGVSGKIEWESLFYLIAPSLIIGLAFSGFITLILLFVIKLINQGRKAESVKRQ